MVIYKTNNCKVCFCSTVKVSNKVKKLLTLEISKLIKNTIKTLKHNNVDLSKNNIIELMPKFVIGNIPIDKKTRKKKQKRKVEQRIHKLYEMAEQFPSQYDDENQRWEGLGVAV